MVTVAAIIRFSVVNHQSFRSFRGGRVLKSVEDLERIVFADDRMKVRWRLFTSLTLPSLDVLAQRHDSFYCLLLVSPTLPAAWRFALTEFALQRPWLRICDVQYDITTGNASEAVLSGLDLKNRLYAFRMDDDDALSSNAIDVIHKASKEVSDKIVLSFDRGFYARPLPLGRLVVREKYFKSPALGLGIFSSRGELISPYNMGGHTSLRFPTVNFDDRPYWLRMIHSMNDSAASVGKRWSIGVSRKKAGLHLSEFFPGLDVAERLAAV